MTSLWLAGTLLGTVRSSHTLNEADKDWRDRCRQPFESYTAKGTA